MTIIHIHNPNVSDWRHTWCHRVSDHTIPWSAFPDRMIDATCKQCRSTCGVTGTVEESIKFGVVPDRLVEMGRVVIQFRAEAQAKIDEFTGSEVSTIPFEMMVAMMNSIIEEAGKRMTDVRIG